MCPTHEALSGIMSQVVELKNIQKNKNNCELLKCNNFESVNIL